VFGSDLGALGVLAEKMALARRRDESREPLAPIGSRSLAGPDQLGGVNKNHDHQAADDALSEVAQAAFAEDLELELAKFEEPSEPSDAELKPRCNKTKRPPNHRAV